MMRGLAIAVVGALLLVVVMLVIISPGETPDGCEYETVKLADASLKKNLLWLNVSGRLTGDVYFELRHRIFGGDEGCSVYAHVELDGALELGSFPLGSPKIKSARLFHPNSSLPPSTQVATTGTLTITRANEKELAGRLQLATHHDRIDAPFSMTLGPGGESVDSDY